MKEREEHNMPYLINFDAVLKALGEAKKLAKPRRFKQAIELIIKLRDVDVRKPENRFNQIVTLPHPPSKNIKICVFGKGDFVLKAREAGADLVLTNEDIVKYGQDRRALRKLAKKFDFFIAEADLMPLIGRMLGPILGPRGKMPLPVPPRADVKPIIDRLRRSIRIRMRNQPLIMCKVGEEDMDPKHVVENINAVFEALSRKYKIPYNIEKVYLKLSMGPPVQVKPW